MVEKEKVIICDMCNKAVSFEKCQLCGKDICEKCNYEIKISSEKRGDGGYVFGVFVPYCILCRERVYKYSGEKESFNELRVEIKKSFVDYVRKAIVLQELEKK